MSVVASTVLSFAVGFAAAYLLKGRGFHCMLVSAEAVTLNEMKMALVVRTDLKMGKGKAAAQCAHAAVSCYKRALFASDSVLQQWEQQGSLKTVLATKEEEGLLTLARDAQKAGLIATVIHDAGHTQLKSGTATVLGIGPGPKELLDQIVGHLKPY